MSRKPRATRKPRYSGGVSDQSYGGTPAVGSMTRPVQTNPSVAPGPQSPSGNGWDAVGAAMVAAGVPVDPQWAATHGVTADAASNGGGAGAAAGGDAGSGQGGPPVDPTLAAQQAQGQLALNLGNAWDTYKTGQIGQQYGNLDNPAADAATNPYSQAALAYKRYNESQRGTGTSYASAGQLYSGALQNATEANAGNYSQNLAGLRQSKQGALDSVTEGGLNRYSSYLGQQGTDSLASIMKALGL